MYRLSIKENIFVANVAGILNTDQFTFTGSHDEFLLREFLATDYTFPRASFGPDTYGPIREILRDISHGSITSSSVR